MDFSKMVRDADVARKHVAILADRTLAAKSDLSIVIPQRYVDIGLADVGREVNTLAIFAVVVGDTYCVSSADAMIRLTPDSFTEFDIGEDKYVEFKFKKGGIISPSLDVLKDDIFIYYIYAEFLSKAKCPAFFNAKDANDVLDTAEKHAGLALGANSLPTELLASYITRDATDPTKFFRHKAKTLHDPGFVFIPLNSVAFSTQDTTSKTSGAYLDQGLTSGLIIKSERISNFENLLRT